MIIEAAPVRVSVLFAVGVAAAALASCAGAPDDGFAPPGEPVGRTDGEHESEPGRPVGVRVTPRLPLGCTTERLVAERTTADPGINALAEPPTDEISALAVTYGGGVAVADFDSDGWLDLAGTGPTGSRLWRNRGDGRFDASDGLAALDPEAWGIAAVDADADGDTDLLSYGPGPMRLHVNDRGLGGPAQVWSAQRLVVSASFTQLDPSAGLSVWLAAHDRDRTPASQHGRLRTVTAEGWVDDDRVAASPATAGIACTSAWFDVDDDGREDLVLLNDKVQVVDNQVLLRTAGGRFEPSPEYSTALQGVGGTMGIAIFDADGDGRDDLFLSDTPTNRLLMRTDTGWVDSLIAAGLGNDPERTVAWGASPIDLQNDGRADLAVAYGQAESHTSDPIEPDAVWRLGAGPAQQVAPALGLDDPGSNRGLVAADLDRDGTLDLVVGRAGRSAVAWLLPCAAGNALELQLRAPGLNTAAIGARVTARAGDRVWRRQVRVGDETHSSGPPEVHFGLGEVDAVDVTIDWPDGGRTELSGLDTGWLYEVDAR